MYVEFEKGQKFTKSLTEISDTCEYFKDAGYILTDNDLIVDIDCISKEVIQKLITMFNIKTETVWTTRGCHFYFKKPEAFRGATRVCSLGFEIEFKHIKNTKAITIKRDGVMREIEHPGVREDLPEIFSKNKKFDSLLGLEDGDGRNNKLFKHRSQLVGMDQWQNVMRFINNFVITEPLDEKEFQAIVRDMNIEPEKNNEPEIAEQMVKKYNIVKYLGFIYFHDKRSGEYISDDDLLKRVISKEVGLQRSTYIDEIMKQIDILSKIVNDDTEFDIKFKNGFLRDGQFIEIDYDEFTPFSIDINYIPDAEPLSIVDTYVSHLTNDDPEYEQLLFEVLAHCLIVNKEFKRLLAKFFFFVGDGGNGKGTLLTIIKQILKPKNCTSLSPSNMSDERYIVTMIGKLANLADDVSDLPINNDMMKQIKNISTCDFITVRALYKQSKNTQLSASLIFTSNHILKSFEKGESYRRRVMWMPMYKKPIKKDPKFITNITSEKALEYWMSQIMEGYFRLYKNSKFSDCKIVEDFNIEYHKTNNPTTEFLDDYDMEDIIGKRPPEVFNEFTIWAEENDIQNGSKKMLKEAIEERFGLRVKPKKIQGKTAKVYLPTEEIN